MSQELWIALINSFSNSNDQVDALMLLAIPSLTQFSEMIPIFLLLLPIPFFLRCLIFFFNFQILILTYLGTYLNYRPIHNVIFQQYGKSATTIDGSTKSEDNTSTVVHSACIGSQWETITT